MAFTLGSLRGTTGMIDFRISFTALRVAKSFMHDRESNHADKLYLSQNSRFFRPTQPVSRLHAQQPHVLVASPVHLEISAHLQALAVRCGPPNYEVLVPFFPRR